ncbi:hypothetical protein THRCLA_22666 [Thraustotheca clavata]|uniref:Uncharacterized protein n=1 Tax=Thraustotheca clavata TaxID=74557 RepID=A0A1V9YV26_9STRA|nr:hypothetical protein THRCLA_22666 [Thraustotheca clavata]
MLYITCNGSSSRIGRLDILNFLHNNRTEGCTKDAMICSYKRTFEIRGVGCTRNVWKSAIYNRDNAWCHFKIQYQWLLTKMDGLRGIDEIFLSIIKLPQMVMKNWHFEMVSALFSRCFHVLKYLGLNDCAHGAANLLFLCLGAISIKNFEMLIFLIDYTNITRQLQDKLMLTAEYNGSLDIIKWLIEKKGFRCTLQIHPTALSQRCCRAQNGNNDTFWSYCKFIDTAAERGDLDTIKLLHRSCMNHVPWIEHQQPNRTEGCTKQAMTFAATRGHLDGCMKFVELAIQEMVWHQQHTMEMLLWRHI